jgi:hypothetical protein
VKDKKGKPLPFKPQVYALNYDWSSPTLLDFKRVRFETKRILEHSGCKAYMYVAHSMGGLIAVAQMICRPQEKPNSSKDIAYLGTVSVAAPLNGAPETLRRVQKGVTASWYDFKKQFIAMLLADEGWKCALLVPHIPGFADLFHFGTSIDVEKKACSLIEEHFAINNKRYLHRESLDPYVEVDKCWQYGNDHKQGLVAQTKVNIALAQRFHKMIADKAKVWRDKTVSVYLEGANTVVDFKDPATLEPEVTTAGDGTVPSWSQTYNCYNCYRVEGGIDHGDALSNEKVFPFVYSAMSDLFNKAKEEGTLKYHENS